MQAHVQDIIYTAIFHAIERGKVFLFTAYHTDLVIVYAQYAEM